MKLKWKKEWTVIVLLFVGLRIVYSILGFIISNSPDLQTSPDDEPFIIIDPLLHTDEFSRQFINVWERWDTGWYLKIAMFGFDKTTPGITAFSPLYPWLTRLLAALTGDYLLSALLLSSFFALTTLILLYEVASQQGLNNRQALNSVFSLAMFPAAFFLFAAYTESLFLTFVLASLLAAYKKRWLAAGLLASVATLARHQGVLLVPVLAWIFLADRAEALALPPVDQVKIVFGLVTSRQGWGKLFRALRNPGWLSFLLPVLTYFLYSWYLQTYFVSISGGLAGYWHIRIVTPWEGIRQVFERLATQPRIGMDYIDAVVFVVILALLCANLKRLSPAFVLYSFLTILLVVMRGNVPYLLSGFTRYLMAAFPVFLVIGAMKNDKLRLAAWSVSALVQVFLVYVFLNWGWVA